MKYFTKVAFAIQEEYNKNYHLFNGTTLLIESNI